MGRDRNKGGVGNFFTIPRARRSEIRRLAREYAAELLRQQEPYWAIERGLPEHEVVEFSAELDRIADRISRATYDHVANHVETPQ
jgi:hypothetical protein